MSNTKTYFAKDIRIMMLQVLKHLKSEQLGMAKVNGRHHRSCLGQLFNNKLGSFAKMHSK
jgi:hypothetical protein